MFHPFYILSSYSHTAFLLKQYPFFGVFKNLFQGPEWTRFPFSIELFLPCICGSVANCSMFSILWRHQSCIVLMFQYLFPFFVEGNFGTKLDFFTHFYSDIFLITLCYRATDFVFEIHLPMKHCHLVLFSFFP